MPLEFTNVHQTTNCDYAFGNLSVSSVLSRVQLFVTR